MLGMEAMIEREIKTVRKPVVAGYAHAGVVIRPWTAYVDGRRLENRRGVVRRFATEEAALAAAQRDSCTR